MDDPEFVGCLAVIAFTAAVLAVLCIWLSAASCHAKFEGSGLQSDWGIISGCRVNAPGQGWIPSENYRVL